MKRNKRRDSNFWESANLNNATYSQYYQRLAELSMVMFEWKNLPETIDERFLEMVLFTDGYALFSKDEEIGMICTRVAMNGTFNLYQIPKNRRAYAINGYQRNLTDKNSVICFNNYMHTNSQLDVEMFARRLYNMDRTIDINLNAQKTPIMIICDEEQRLTMKNVYMQYDGNMPVIFANKAIDLNSIKVVTTGAPYIADKVRQEKIQTWNEALTYLGISNTNITKKERMITDEVIRSQGGTIASRYSRLNMRRQACLQLRKMFPEEMGNVWCDYRDDFREVDDEFVLTGDSGDGSAVPTVTDIRTRA